MMKKVFTVAVALLTLTGLAYGQQVKVLTVDLGSLYDQYHKAKEAREALQFDAQTAEDELDSMLQEARDIEQEARSMQQELSDESSPLSEEKRRETQRSLMEMQQQYQQIQQSALQFKQQQENLLAQRRQSIMQVQLNDIRQVVIEVAEKRGANLVLNSGSQLAIVYADPSFDVTDDVLELLNRNAAEEE